MHRAKGSSGTWGEEDGQGSLLRCGCGEGLNIPDCSAVSHLLLLARIAPARP